MTAIGSLMVAITLGIVLISCGTESEVILIQRGAYLVTPVGDSKQLFWVASTFAWLCFSVWFFVHILASRLRFMTLTEDQILSLAPDDSSKKAGKDLSVASKWGMKQFSDRAIWGECQGSGKLPYQTQVDLQNVAFKCSCPSRKFPCKHGLGLLLLFVRDRKVFSEEKEPDWVLGWLDKRSEREEKKTEKKSKEKPVDAEAQVKRQENRLKRVEDGISELTLWMNDIVRNGLLAIPSKQPSFFETMARRMIDAQAPGLATMVRDLGSINFYREDWQTPFLDQLVRISLVVNGFSRMDSVSAEMQEELKTQIGFPQNQDLLKTEKGIRDDWFVLSKQVSKEDALTTERNWLFGINSARYALVLQFYVKGQLPELSFVPGSCLDAELVFFKGARPLRALVKEQHGYQARKSVAGYQSWEEVLISQTKLAAENPFVNNLPAIVENVVPVRSGNQVFLKDSGGCGVRCPEGFDRIWQLLSISGGQPIRIFTLGREHSFEPISVWLDDQYLLFS